MSAIQEGEHAEEIVLLIHGIRTRGNWQSMVKRVIERPPGREVWPIKYGRFDALRFLLPAWVGTRAKPIARVEREYRHAVRRNPGARVSVIAHSYGTYAIASLLVDKPDIRLHRLVMCGSILDKDFRWDQISDRIGTPVTNDCGDRDFWPLLATSLSWSYGPSGHYGFGAYRVRDRHHNFRHSDYFEEEFVKEFWLPLFDEDRVAVGDDRRDPPWGFEACGWWGWKWIVYPAVVCLMVLAALAIWHLLWGPGWYDGTLSQFVEQYDAAVAAGKKDAFHWETDGQYVAGEAIVCDTPATAKAYVVSTTNCSDSDTKVYAVCKPSSYRGDLVVGTRLEIAGRIKHKSANLTYPLVVGDCWRVRIIDLPARESAVRGSRSSP